MTTLEGRRVLVVGGSAGIGRAFATQAVAQGAQVVGDVGLRRPELVDEVAGAQLLDREQRHDGGPRRVGEQPQELGVQHVHGRRHVHLIRRG